MELFALGARVLLWLVILVPLLFSVAATQLGKLGFLASCPHGLQSSSDKLLSEFTLYANLVHVELVSPSINAWR